MPFTMATFPYTRTCMSSKCLELWSREGCLRIKSSCSFLVMIPTGTTCRKSGARTDPRALGSSGHLQPVIFEIEYLLLGILDGNLLPGRLRRHGTSQQNHSANHHTARQFHRHSPSRRSSGTLKVLF